MPNYSNGYVPADLLVVFNRGHNDRDGNWTHSFPPATYARHLALIRRARARTGRTLALNYGWTAYRPWFAQSLLKRYYTSIGQPMMSATPGTSSHGGFWENRQTMAGDYSNWAWVYENHGGRAAFAEDCRSVGLLPNMIVPARGYPDEPWHVIDPNPWSAVPAFDGVVLPFAPAPIPIEEDLMELVIKAPNGIVVHLAPGVKHDFANPAEYGAIRDSLEFIRARKGTDAMKLPPLNEVVGVDWETYIRFCAYFNVPTAAAFPAPGGSAAEIAAAVEERLRDDFAAIPDAVNDDAAERLKD